MVRVLTHIAFCALVAEVAAMLGTIAVAVGLALWPGSTVAFSVDLFGSVLLVSSVVVQMVVLLFIAPFHAIWQKQFCTGSLVPWRGALWGGSLYSIVCLLIASISGVGVVDFFVSKAFVFPLLCGAIYGSAFEFVFHLLHLFGYAKHGHLTTPAVK